MKKVITCSTCLTRLHLYKGDEHPHAAQKPEAWTQV